MAAGSIVISLLMATGSFETDTKRAAKKLEEFKSRAAETGRALGKGLVAGAAAAAFALDQLVKGAAEFKDLEETIGASAESIASLSISAATAGVSTESMAGDLVKLTKNLSGVDDESKAAGAALSALGIPIEEFKKLDPVAQVDALTKAFGGFADGSQKTAVAMSLFGKSGAEMLRVFKALEEAGGRQVVLTQEQIDLADAYADQQAKSAAELKVYAQAAATQALPALNALTEAGKEWLAELIGIDKQSGQLGANSAVKDFAEGAAKALGFIVDAGDGVVRVFKTIGTAIGGAAAAAAAAASGDFKAAKNILQEMSNDIDGILNRSLFSDKLEQAFEASKTVQPGPKDTRPALNFDGAVKASKGSKDDPTKKLLDTQLDALKGLADQEKTLLAERNRFIDLYNEQGLLSIEAYYAARKVAADDALAGEQKAIDAQIKALEKFRDAPGRKQSDKADVDGKIADLLRQRAELERAAGVAGIEAAIKQAQEEKRLADEIQGVNAQLLELQGNLRGAAAIRFDQQNESLKKRLEASGNTDALGQLDALRKAALAQAEYGQETVKADKVLQQLGATEERISIARQLGAASEIEGLTQLGAARQDAVRQLEAIVEAQEAVARASGSDVLVRQAEAARLELEKLKATADPLSDSLRALFTDGFGDAFADVLTGAKSAKDAFKDFGDEVARQIIRMTTQGFSEKLFGSISGAIGGTTGGGSGFGGFLSSIGSFFGGAKAGGGDVISGRSYLVGENGPERFVPRTAGTILPSERGSSAQRTQVNNINITVPGSTSHQTASQIGAEVSRKLAAANARGN